MTDINLRGTISVPNDQEQQFLKDFDEFLQSKGVTFRGKITSFEFDDVEIVEDIEEVTN